MEHDESDVLVQATLAAARILELGGKNEDQPLMTTTCTEDDPMDTANDEIYMQASKKNVELVCKEQV